MTKIILTTSLLIVAVFTVAYLYFSNISASGRNIDKALSLIPQDASLIFQISNDTGIYEIFADYKLFTAITGQNNQEETLALKSVFFSSKQISKELPGQKIFLSFHPKGDSTAFLWVMPLPENLKGSDVSEALKDNNQITYKETETSSQVQEIFIKSIKRTFYLHLNENFVAGSYSKTTLQEALDDKTSKISKEFIEEINRANNQNQNSPATLFLNFGNSIPYLSGFFKDKLNGNFSLLNNFNALATLNMNFKSDALMFNGITETDTSRQSYINLFLNQKAVRNPLKRIVPSNTANFIAYGVSNYAVFHKDLQKLLVLRKDLANLNVTLTKIRDESGIDPDRDIKKFWANEFITFQLSTQEKYAAIQLSNGRQLQFFLDPLSSEYSENIRHLNYPGLFYYYFGDGLKQFNKPFYTILDNQMIISNSPGSLQRYLNRYSKNRLFENEEFINFDQLVADHSSISIFIHNKNSASNIKSMLKPAYAEIFRSNGFGLKDFYGLSYQWSSDGDHFFTNLYAGYNKGPLSANDTALPDSLSAK